MRASSLLLTLPLTLAVALALALALTWALAVTAAPKTHRSWRSLTLCLTTTTTPAAPAASGAMPTAIVRWLPDRELRHCTCGHRLALRARERGSNERATHWTFLGRRGCLGHGRRRWRRRRERGWERRRSVGDRGRWNRAPGRRGVMAVAGRRHRGDGRRQLVVHRGWRVFRVGIHMMREPRRRLRSLQSVEHLVEKSRLRPLAPLRRHLALFEFVFRVTDDAAGLFDAVVDHRHDGVIGDTALARTVIVQHVAGPEPALLHALPRETKAQITVQEGRTLTSCPGASPHPTTAQCRNLMKEQPDGLRRRTRGRYSVTAAFTFSKRNRVECRGITRTAAGSPKATVSPPRAPGERRAGMWTAASFVREPMLPA